MRHAGIEQFEKVQIVNLENGNRWETYVIKSNDSRAFTLNGGGAFLGDVGDKCVVICYSMRKRFKPFDIIFCDENNFVSQVMKYENS
ncbi:MAG: hypothetical protein DRH08_05280 [Deltaproteobacteria bacterium]|nr:MAG: hypothetical protein DRH08_05280 [Deltaproteobacteria bacterium]